MYKIYGLMFCGFFLGNQLVACSSEQLKRGTYYSVHEKQRQDCMAAGRTDCEQYKYDSYDEYQQKKNEQ